MNLEHKAPLARRAGSACRFKIVATTDVSVRTFQGTAVARPGQFATLDELLIGLISGIVREEKLALLGLTIEASLESPNAQRERPAEGGEK